MSNWPRYEDLVQDHYDMIDGFHSLGIIAKHRPDIALISLDGHSIQDKNFDWLSAAVDCALAADKKAAIVVWDEDWMSPHNQKLYDLLNSYQHEPVWWITQTNKLDEWYHYRGLSIKVLELQWWLLNDCLAYRELHQPVSPCADFDGNYLCMLGRFEPHKYELGKTLHQSGLSQYGLITVANGRGYPADHRTWSSVNPVKLYANVDPLGLGKTRANVKRGRTWASGNVENYLELESQFSNIPLIINPDSGFGIFQLTEKLLWPALLGKLFLVYGRPHVMASMQRFWDIDMSRYANLVFDSILNDQDRLDAMVDLNQDLIKDCVDIWQDLQPELQQARWSLGQRLYDFTTKQLDSIH